MYRKTPVSEPVFNQKKAKPPISLKKETPS